MGPDIVRAYNINVVDAWYPKKKNEFSKFIKAVPNYTYLYDFNDIPFYILGQGYIDHHDCSVKPQDTH